MYIWDKMEEYILEDYMLCFCTDVCESVAIPTDANNYGPDRVLLLYGDVQKSIAFYFILVVSCLIL